MKIIKRFLLLVGALLQFTQSTTLQYTSLEGAHYSRNSNNAPEPGIDEYLFFIRINNKTGFIDSLGNVVIPPRFEYAQEFSEGLCAVRDDGMYGFINTRGEMVIAPAFDYATNFQEGYALVYKDGRPLFINHDGDEVITIPYAFMSPFTNGRSYVRTASNKQGVIDKSGKLVIDTVYRHVGEFNNGFACVVGTNHEPNPPEGKKQKLEVSVIDENGKMIIPFGTYSEINGPSEGFLTARIPSKRKDGESKDVILNTHGEITYTLRDDEYSWFEGGVSNGIIRINVPIMWM